MLHEESQETAQDPRVKPEDDDLGGPGSLSHRNRPGGGGIDPRISRLRNAKLIATGAVLGTAALFVAAHFLPLPEFWRRLLQAAGEAGTVGGLADWFAVTALFRRPLGLPIPHTALIPSRKGEIAHSLARFVEEHFLDPVTIVARLKESDRAAELGAWLAGEQVSQFLASRAVDMLRQLVERGTHLDLVDAVLPLLRVVGREARQMLNAEIGKRTGWLVPKFVDRKLARAVGDEMDRVIEALGTEGSQERAHLDDWLRARLDEVPPVWREAAMQVWTGLRRDVSLEGVETPELIATIAGLIQKAGNAVIASEPTRAWINGAIERAVIGYIVPWRPQIGRYIEGVVRRWNAAEVTRIIELQVGRDLQYVRLNGTLIGALIGVGLFLASWFFGG